MMQTKTDTHELEKAVREAAAHEDQEIAGIPGFITDEEQETADLPDETPYEDLAESLRSSGATEERIWEALTDLAENRGDDWEEVFAVCFGDPSVVGPCEPF
jgi:hypothetical protein